MKCFTLFTGIGTISPFQYSCLENSMDRGAWQSKVHGVAKELDVTERLNHNILVPVACWHSNYLIAGFASPQPPSPTLPHGLWAPFTCPATCELPALESIPSPLW